MQRTETQQDQIDTDLTVDTHRQELTYGTMLIDLLTWLVVSKLPNYTLKCGSGNRRLYPNH